MQHYDITKPNRLKKKQRMEAKKGLYKLYTMVKDSNKNTTHYMKYYLVNARVMGRRIVNNIEIPYKHKWVFV